MIMNTVICKELIVSTLSRRGEGVKHSPIRIITEVFEKDGTLIAEYDPMPGTFTQKDLLDFAHWLDAVPVGHEKSRKSIVIEWLDSIESNKQ